MYSAAETESRPDAWSVSGPQKISAVDANYWRARRPGRLWQLDHGVRARPRATVRRCCCTFLLCADLGWVRITGRRPYGEDVGVLGVAVRPGSAVPVEEIGES
jgi:hypothetical protein